MTRWGTLWLVAWAGLLAGQTASTLYFQHFYREIPVGRTWIRFTDGGAEEETVLTQEVPGLAVGGYLYARYRLDRQGEVRGATLRYLEGGQLEERTLQVLPPAPGTGGRLRLRLGRPGGAAQVVPLLRRRPWLLGPPELLTPLLLFGRRAAWRAVYDPLSQIASIQVVALSPPLQAEEGQLVKRTHREYVPIGERRLAATAYTLAYRKLRLLVSFSRSGNELLKVEEPALGWRVQVSPLPPPEPAVRGIPVEAACEEMTRLEAPRAWGLDLAERRDLAAVTYEVDLPYAGKEPPVRPWQAFQGELKDGRLRGRLTVTSFREGLPGAPPQVPSAPLPPELAARLPALPAADLEALSRWFGRLAFAFNVADPVRALEVGFANREARLRLAEAVLRARGIPVRRVEGLLCTGRAFVLHVWLEAGRAGRWCPLDPLLGALTPLHITLGPGWRFPPGAPFRLAVRHFRFRPERAARIRWPLGETRVYGIYLHEKDKEPRLFGVLAATPGTDPVGLRIETDLILDRRKLGGGGRVELAAVTLVEPNGRPRWFRVSTWLGGRRHTLLTHIEGDTALIEETLRQGAEKRRDRVALEDRTFLVAESFYDHWAVVLAALEPAAARRRRLRILVPQRRRLYHWTLQREGEDRVLVPALEQPVQAFRFTVPERGLRLWVTPGRVLLRLEDQETHILVRLEPPKLRERF